MKFKKQILASVCALAAVTGVYAQQPYGGCWFPDEVINWSPSTDVDAKFNRSRIPLQSRIDSNEGSGQVETATITNKMCSLTPSQGDNNFLAYQPTYWQYMEKFINWGGAGNEGIFVLPPAGTIDAAHLNGVKILGTLFFMPRTIGGRDGWIEAMLTKDASGKYPYAVKMYEIAKYFGFDGWFINKELDNGKRVDEWADFIKCFGETADAAGDTYMEIQWYDASTNPTIDILKSHRNTSQFLEYNSTGDKSSYASELGCTANDIYHRLYSGIECSQAGLYGFSVPGAGSIALFTPEQHTYKVLTDDLWSNPENTAGQKAYDIQKEVFEREHNTWAGGSSFSGISSKVSAMSTITGMPFTSSFSVGLGKHRFVKGEKLNTQDWNATSVQSILPHWRSNVDGMTFAYDYDDAYNHGNCIKLSGNLTAGNHTWRLFKTKIAVDNGGVLRLVYKTNGIAPEVKVSDVTLSGAKTSTVNGWTVAEYDLASLNGKTISEIDVLINAAAANSGYELKLGELSVLPDNYNPAALSVSDVEINGNLDGNSGDIRLSWSYDFNNDFDHFDIYLTNAKGRRLVGQTRGEGFYVPRFNREGNESSVKVELVAVMKGGNSSVVKSQDVDFRAAAAPVITVTPVKSYAKVGDLVTLTVSGTDNPTSFEWTLPASVELVKGSLTDSSIEVEALAEGRQNISVKVGNDRGISTFNDVAFDVFSDVAYKEVHNAAIGKVISCGRAVTGKADYLIDGDSKPSNKDFCWSDISTNPYVIVDLKTPHTVYDFAVYDNHSLIKGGEDNIANYRILVSDNGSEWKEIVNATNVSDENIHRAYIVPTVARYVKLQPYSDKRFTCRLYEFEITARDNSRITIEAPHTINLEPKETQTITVAYNMNGEEVADNFGLSLSSESSYITFTEPKNDGNGHFTFDVTAAKKIGKAELTVALQNGEAKRQTFIDFILDSKDVANSLNGTEAEMRKFNEDYVAGATYDSQKTGNLTDGDTTTEGLTEEMYEDPCISRNDLWAVFTNPRRFSLGKVKVFIPAGNKGVNSNDKEGYVNNAISIRTSNDGLNWNIVESFDNLKDVSELTCYLPEADPFTYLAVVCDVNTYFYPSLAEVEAYAQLEADGPKVVPVAIANGFNYDIIAEERPVEDHADLEFSYGCFFTSNVNNDFAISSPDSRIIVTKNGTTFELADYTQKNALAVENKNTDYTLKFVEPIPAEEIYVLCNCTSTREITATIKYEDGSVSEEFIIDVPRSDYDTDNIDEFAITDLKVLEDETTFGNKKHGMNEVAIKANAEKNAVAVNFRASKSPEFWVFGISALADLNGSKIRLTPSAATIKVAPESTENLVVTYNMNGEAREANFSADAEFAGNGIILGEITEDKAACTFTVPVNALSDKGNGEITFTVTNGELAKACKVKVSVEKPSEFTGWKHDVIAESTPSNEFTTKYLDKEGWVLYTSAVKEEGAVAGDDRTIVTSKGTVFTLEPYDAPNALRLDANDDPAELTAVKPSFCEQLHILAISANGDCDVEVTVGYEDGSTDEPQTITIQDWYGDATGTAVHGFDRIFASNSSWSYDVDDFDGQNNFRLFEFAINLDATKKFQKVSFQHSTNRTYPTILALAKAEKTSGIDSIESDGDKTIEAVYNIQGIEVKNPTSGLYIVRYSDGSTRKVIIK